MTTYTRTEYIVIYTICCVGVLGITLFGTSLLSQFLCYRGVVLYYHYYINDNTTILYYLFYQVFDNTTQDDIELRVCANEVNDTKDTPLDIIELCIQWTYKVHLSELQEFIINLVDF